MTGHDVRLLGRRTDDRRRAGTPALSATVIDNVCGYLSECSRWAYSRAPLLNGVAWAWRGVDRDGIKRIHFNGRVVDRRVFVGE